MGKHLQQLRRESTNIDSNSLTKLTEAPFVSFVSESNVESVVGNAIREAIGRARDWQSLSVIWPHMDAVFTIGNLTAAEHDSLVSRLKARSKALPEVAAIGHTIEKG